ncbi:evolutionarily conserved signaling intermediate in Toll pathway, mitochondrial-like [Actinia tenebrosa]|uniref:Evolutionarily conserved signaling intermediate in Toll pathway, mitochondrial n=1 Tax=Actinia tenebrosa TaxID=6105 RepID=A0A6P8HQ22_ACTTE|nr:evolutionarily conserved signaling intermediate in Toll pathway, mitochondrial-like [Actinia tenebrosa]
MMSSLRFARFAKEFMNYGVRKRSSLLSCPVSKRFCSSAPKPSDNDSKIVTKTLNSGVTKVIELAEKPIQSKQVAKSVPSTHVVKFEQAMSQGKTRENFIEVLEAFTKDNQPRRGHMELLKTSLEYMEKFGLEGDLEAYNAMLNVFPRERFKNRTLFDAIWPKMHPQVDLALEILTKMEENVIKPSLETYDLCEEIYGRASQPVQKCRRLAFWLTKLEEMFPHPLPHVLPEDEVELSKLALERMTKDPIPILIYQEGNEEKGIDFIVGSQTLNQRSILESYDAEKPVYVEGPHFVWIRRLKRHFYTLRSHGCEGKEEEDLEDGEGAVLAVCMTNTSCSQETLQQWISRLQDQTPNLANIKVIFNLHTTEQGHL